MVEWMTIGSLISRKRLKAKDNYKHYPVFAVTNSLGFALSSSLHDFTIHSEDTSNYLVVEKNDFAYNPSRLNIGSIAYFDNYSKGLISPMYVVFHADENKVLTEYLFIVLKSEAIRNKIDSLKEEGARFRFDFKRWDLISIPIPSLSEQERIVGILDTFTASIDNLKEQIAQRSKQYEYYRDQLLDLEGKEGVEMMKIKDICINICSGGTPSTSHKEYYEGSVNWLRTQEVDWGYIYDTEKRITEEAIANSSAKLIPENCVIVAMYGATAAKVAINKIPLTTNQACCNLEIDKSKALYKFVFYWLCKEYLNLKAMGEGSQNNINGQKVKGYPVPLPSLSEQSRIVSILDTFEASITNLESQLAQREKQYEYYRNKLLTFE